VSFFHEAAGAYADGTLFILHHLQSSTWIDPTGTRPAPGNPPFPAIVDSRPFPPTDGSRAQFVWFAYASGQFFKGLTNATILPIWDPEDPRTRRQSCEIEMNYNLASAPPQLPLSVKFLNNGFYNSYNPATRAVDFIPLDPPYDKGFTKASYEVLSITNTASNSLPQAFVFTIYSTPLGSDKLPFERLIIRGWTTAVSDTAREHAGRPLFKGKASVLDYRIAHQDSVERLTLPPRYSIHDGKWLTAGDVERYRKSLESGKRLADPNAEAWNRRRMPALILLLALIVCPAIWIARDAFRRGKSVRSENIPDCWFSAQLSFAVNSHQVASGMVIDHRLVSRPIFGAPQE
jgi:hypothetical protein